MREGMTDRGRVSIEGGESICTEEQGVKNGDNLVASWCTGSGT